MGVQVEWDNIEQTVLRYTVAGRWTWEDFYVARDHARHLADLAPVTRVNSIIDIRTGSGRLGHANASTTLDIYAQFVEQADEHAADVLGRLLGPNNP